MRRPINRRKHRDNIDAPGRNVPLDQRPAGRPHAAQRGARTRRGRRKAHSWASALDAQGLLVVEGPLEVRATSRPGHPLAVAAIGWPSGQQWQWTVTVSNPKIAPRLALAPEDRLTRVKKLVVGEDLLTGDEVFDARVHVSGDEVETLARLSHRVRKAVLMLLESGRVVDRTVHWSETSDGPQPRGFAERMRRWMALARMLGADLEAERRLLKQAQWDDSPGVRLRALTVYLGRGARPAVADMRRLLRDEDAHVRLRAARIEPSIEHLNELASDDEAPVDVRTEAVVALGAAAQRAGIAGIDRGAAVVEPEVVMRALRPWLDRSGAAEVVGALGEAAALAVLTDGPRTLRPAAIERLGAVGTERSVPELIKLADAFFGGRALKSQARTAAESITRRIGGLRRGGLSVTGGEAGGLAVASDDLER